MKRAVLLCALIALASSGKACITCNNQVREGIFNSSFYPNLLVMLSAFIVIALIVALLSWMAMRQHRARLSARTGEAAPSSVPLVSAAMVLGIGLGGFADGIVLHQILQWHEMLSNKLAPDTLVNKSVNMFWDGIFHALCLIVTVVGVCLFWRLLKRENINRSGYLLAGGLLSGWGLFNLVEGIIDHHLLRLHNVLEASPAPEVWNYGFLAIGGAGLLLLGWLLIRRGRAAARTSGSVATGHG